MRVAIATDPVLDEHKERMLGAILESLEGEYETEVVPFDERFMGRIREFDLVFNMATGGGKDSRQVHVPAVLDHMGIPYTGSPPLAHAFCMDKSVTKAILIEHGFDTPNYFVVKPGEVVNEDHGLEYPLIIKLLREGSSKGLRKESVVWDFDALVNGVRWVHENFDEPALVEEFIDGTELTIAVLEIDGEPKVLPVSEIDFSGLPEGVERFFSDRVKNSGEFDDYIDYHTPPRLDGEAISKIEGIALDVFKILGLRNYARLDMRLKDGKFHILEVNSLPMLVPNYSHIPRIAESAGMDYPTLIKTIVDSARKFWGI